MQAARPRPNFGGVDYCGENSGGGGTRVLLAENDVQHNTQGANGPSGWVDVCPPLVSGTVAYLQLVTPSDHVPGSTACLLSCRIRLPLPSSSGPRQQGLILVTSDTKIILSRLCVSACLSVFLCSSLCLSLCLYLSPPVCVSLSCYLCVSLSFRWIYEYLSVRRKIVFFSTFEFCPNSGKNPPLSGSIAGCVCWRVAVSGH